jgi:hypothetical protein
MVATEPIEFTTALNPVHMVSDTVALKHERLNGVYVESNWRLPMKAGELMTHKAKRVTYA